MLNIILSLDMAQSEGQRDEFYAELGKLAWKKLPNVDTVWARSEQRDSDKTSVENASLNIGGELLQLANTLKIKRISYVIQVGNNEPLSRVIEKRHGILSVHRTFVE